MLKKQRTTPKKTNPMIIPKEKVAREAEEEETSAKDHICSASIVERLDTHQISVGLCGNPSKTDITRRKMTIKTKMLVNLLILLIVLLHVVILELMK